MKILFVVVISAQHKGRECRHTVGRIEKSLVYENDLIAESEDWIYW